MKTTNSVYYRDNEKCKIPNSTAVFLACDQRFMWNLTVGILYAIKKCLNNIVLDTGLGHATVELELLQLCIWYGIGEQCASNSLPNRTTAIKYGTVFTASKFSLPSHMKRLLYIWLASNQLWLIFFAIWNENRLFWGSISKKHRQYWFKWRFAGVLMMAGLVALWFFGGSGPVLLRNPIFLWFSRGVGGGVSAHGIGMIIGINVTGDEYDEWPPCSLFISITTENGYQNNYYFISNEKRWLMSFLLVNNVIQLIFLALLAKLRGLRKHPDPGLATGINKTYEPVRSLFWV